MAEESYVAIEESDGFVGWVRLTTAYHEDGDEWTSCYCFLCRRQIMKFTAHAGLARLMAHVHAQGHAQAGVEGETP